MRAPPGRLVGWVLLALHLARIPPPGPRAHHRRVAAAVLDDSASGGNGQLFALSNGDLALLFRPTDGGAAIGRLLSQLFQADMPDAAGLFDLWALPEATTPAMAWVTGHAADGERPAPAPEPRSGPGALAAMDAIAQSGALSDLLHRQTAVLLRPGRRVALVPLFREVAISTAVLEARIAGHTATADPFLFSHLAARLDHRMLGALQDDVTGGALRDDVFGGGLLPMGRGAAALHVNMTVAGILSDAFARLIAACPAALAAGLRVGVEVPLIDAFADPAGFVQAQAVLHQAGLGLVLDGVTHQALAVTRLSVLSPMLVKLRWAPAMTTAGPALNQAIARLGPERIVLDHTDTETAVAWGLGCGITRFQGRLIDALLAAERVRACPAAAPCTPRQCMERASATGPAGRAGCRNLSLLDLGAPFGSGPTGRPADGTAA